MTKAKMIQTVLMTIGFMTLTACGSSLDASLPDDPTNEVPNAIADVGGGDEASQSEPVPTDSNTQAGILAKYDYIDPSHVISDKHLKAAILYFDANKAKFKNQNYVSVIDYSQHSSKKRFHVIDMKTGAVWSMRVSHGKGSDSNHDGYLDKFSNVSGSNATSEGFMKTAETYTGSNGYSLRLDGLSSTNTRLRSRAVVIHGADYVQESNVKQGRSWGCPAVAQENRTKLINMIKGGSLIYSAK